VVFLVAQQIRIPDRVGEPGGVGQQVAQRDRPSGCPKTRGSGVVEANEDLDRGHFGQPLG
jgi:hypothetical protein